MQAAGATDREKVEQNVGQPQKGEKVHASTDEINAEDDAC